MADETLTCRCFGLRQLVGGLRAVELEPRMRGLDRLVDVLDVLDALRLEPLPERAAAVFRVDRHAVFPGRTAAEHARVVHAAFRRKREAFSELRVADAGR